MYTNMPSGCLSLHVIVHSDVVIGFESTDYTVSETDGQIILVVRVLEGQVSGRVVLYLTTRDDTAVCKAKLSKVLKSVELLTCSSVLVCWISSCYT